MSTNGIIKPQIGLLEWFHIGEYERVENSIERFQQLGIKHLRTGISWADYYSEEGVKWYNWLIPRLAKEVEILPCFLYTPPSEGLLPKTSSPPKNPKAFADFLDTIVSSHGKHFEWVELWNEPNNQSEYDYTLDRHWSVFTDMIGKAAYWMKQLHKKTLLGGMSPVDPNWLQLLYNREVMNYIDVIGIHHFPHVFDDKWYGWEHLINQVKEIIQQNNGQQKIWITETGYSTWQHDERKQLEVFLEASKAPVERIYWYGLNDLDQKYPTVDGFHKDEREYTFGLVKTDGTEKLLYRLLAEKKATDLGTDKWLSSSYKTFHNKKSNLIFGGSGFIGTNMAKTLLDKGEYVTIFDNLSRPGVERNLRWLKEQYPEKLNIEIADIRNKYAVHQAVAQADFVFHFAAQVAVTTSCEYPETDFDINAKGTLNILEAIKNSQHQPPILFTSTNKVYGALDDIDLVLENNRYQPADDHILEHGVAESRKLDFHSPYGCSKGIADSYIQDYIRTFGIKGTIFRMSCIYGPHQFGTEDQGWVAHFLLKAMRNEPLTIYGDGKQVRDILFVEDLIEAMLIAKNQIDKVNGMAFNMGGGASNSISLLELVAKINDLQDTKIPLKFSEWRPGDQKYYVSDTRLFKNLSSWEAQTSAHDGIKKLYYWLLNVQDKATLQQKAKKVIV